MLSDFGRRLPENKIMCLKLRSLNLFRFAFGYTYSGLPEAPKGLIVQQNPYCSLIVVHKAYCCSVVTVNNKNNVHRLTLDCSIPGSGGELGTRGMVGVE